jgi:hypothetical protein
MQNQNNKMSVLFYTGLSIIVIPVLIIGLIAFFSSYADVKNTVEIPVQSIQTDTPKIERKIVYDTVRVEIPIVKTKKKKENLDSLSIQSKDSVNLVLIPETLQKN